MPEEPAKLDETLDAKPYEPPKEGKGRRRLRLTAKVLLVVGLCPLLLLCAGWFLGVAGADAAEILFIQGVGGLIVGVPLAAVCMLLLAFASPGSRLRWLISCALLVVSASIGLYVSYHLRTWQFHRAVATADRLRVRTGGGCCCDPAKQETLIEVSGREQVGRIVGQIRIASGLLEGARGCMCCGWPTLEFYEGNRLIAAVSYHHDVNLRWHGGRWPGDASLTREGIQFLHKWLSDNNATREQWEKAHPPKEGADDQSRE